MHRIPPALDPSSASRDPAAASSSNHAARGPRGFTLTELLVVIAIIAMLVAITSVAVMRGLDTAKQTRIKVEVDQLDSAFKAYREKYGSYPPCDLTDPANNAALKQHVARAFPRYDMGANAVNLIDDLTVAGVDLDNFRPDQALVFWLRGFSNDPLHPFVAVNGNTVIAGAADGPQVKRTPLHSFDTTRLIALVDTPIPEIPAYFPSGVNVSSTPSLTGSPYPVWSTGGAPYLYWDASFYELNPPTAPSTDALPRFFNSPPLYTDAGAATPYWLDTNQNGTSGQSTPLPSDFDTDDEPIEDWANPESFQILATGQDGLYGSASVLVRCYPTGGGYDTSNNLADDDNVTNFCGQARLESAKP